MTSSRNPLKRRSSPIARVLALALVWSTTSCGTDPPRPPAAALPRELPPEAVAGLPVTDDGRPILHTVPVSGVDIHMTYDATLDDPLARWGQCLDRVAGCYRTNRGRLSGCVDLVEVCADPAGGDGCCPQACIDAFHERMDALDSEDAAVDASFLAGDCIPGFRDQIAALDPAVTP